MVPMPPAEEGSVTVVVRVRPQTPREQEGNRQSVVQVVGKSMLVFDPEEPSLPGIFAGFQAADPAPKRKGKDLKFVFDQVFGESASQTEVFENTTKGILDGVLNGYNCSVFAYGATGAGKTHTMLGSEKDPGIMYLTMKELYKQIEARKEEKHCEVFISYQEVYNEQIYDLLEPKGPLAIREDPEKGVVVQALSFHQPKSAEQLLEMLARGNQNRTQHPTDINATSSRSHAVFQIYVKQQDRIVGITQDMRVAKMSLIDLAGSERASATNTKGERLREGANINRSLLALINVINALADAKSKKPHIPYRDSKLTRLLKDSIGGNCRTVMIAAISPSALSYEDTYNTLKYANRAKEIKLFVKSNVLSLDCHISQYATICEQLKAEVADLRGKLRAYEENAPGVNSCTPVCLTPPPSTERDGLLRLKEAGLGCDSLNKGDDGEVETHKQNCGRSSGKGHTEQESVKKPGCSSTESSEPIKWEKLKARLQGMGKEQLEKLVTVILCVAQRQYARLKAVKLLTPDMIAEFDELHGVMDKESSETPEVSAAEGGQVRKLDVGTQVDVQQLEDHAVLLASHPTAKCASPVGHTSGTPPEIMSVPQSTAFKTPPLPTKKRRKSTESTSSSQGSTLSSQKRRAKRRRKACPSPQPVDSLKSWADCTSTPAVEKAKPPGPASLHTPQPCPLMVTKGRVPLGMSAAQNCSTPAPPRSLNATFVLCEDPCPNSKCIVPEFPAWESIEHLSNHQGAPLIPRASMPMFTMKGSSIPRSVSLASRASMQKRKRTTSSASHSLSAPQSRIARRQRSSVKSSQAVDASGHPSCNFAWKWR
ncbi:kinesin-like protein KIF18B isoform X2 [Hemicordylus capensis]|nr:kinesin-like protein KIF18B isoform X2 [Hemicordylus capensis]XP_053115958.1 kinesin-like protein KIF18B isoform X2 [Hemicordylus capensis]XP_053115959.1 kinesin-like protein KIF18B isoform X2 [Hemicordylus capensis]XP_053115960.1 kinesin-like protein KIF18B isoform X2 [Hemicordylus capensis]XP_053115961.1 kinesin-like protein KIF18B isoform X2 [Hemicordylus capensis]